MLQRLWREVGEGVSLNRLKRGLQEETLKEKVMEETREYHEACQVNPLPTSIPR